MPAVVKTVFKGKELSDTSELDAWTINKLTEFAAKLPKSRSAPNKPEQGQAVTAGGDDEDPLIPF
jgi:hypothetical protein